MSTWNASVIVVSDIHLNHPGDKRGQLLLSLLQNIAEAEVEYLVLMGDIFDFCLGSHGFFQRKFAVIGQALQAVVASGTQVVYLEGNHEFKLACLPWVGVQVISEGTHTIRVSSGETIQMAHGDLIYSHKMYRSFRYFVKSRMVTKIATYLPGAWMDGLATRGSEVSRSQDQYRTIEHDKILSAIDDWLEAGTADFGIFGHFHVPYAESRRDGKPGGLFSVESWDKPNVLALRQGQFYRYEFDLRDPRWQVAEALVRKLPSRD
ncbi:MAG: metallophosphoesterase [Proteobacteria bacterium]|nr:metallophosphoesterase [Pseudomonadota bacterium]